MKCSCNVCGKTEDNQLIFWNICLTCQTIAALRAENAKLREALDKATRELFEEIYKRAVNTWATPDVARRHAHKLTESYRAALNQSALTRKDEA